MIDIYNRLRRRKEIQKVTEIDQDKFTQVLKNETEEAEFTQVWFQINVDLDSFLYSISKNRWNFLVTDQEMIIGRGYRNWTPEERNQFFWEIRYEATLIDQHSPDSKNLEECFPDDALTENEKMYVPRKRLNRSGLEDLERMKKRNEQRN